MNFRKKIKNQKRGIAIIEFMFCFFVFAFMLAALYGSWGVVHSAILNSIGARTYAFSIIRNRSNLRIGKDFGGLSKVTGYFDRGTRFFGITTEQGGSDPKWIAPGVSIDFSRTRGVVKKRSDLITGFLGLADEREREVRRWENEVERGDLQIERRPRRTNPAQSKSTIVYLKQGYGICLNAECDTP